jgi:hypothetical protein
MSAEASPGEVAPAPAADPNRLSKEDFNKVAGGTLPTPLPRPMNLPVPVPMPADIPGPLPDTFQRRFRR